ncbi:MAG: hypothetical protein EP297_04680 [Gammaproteobacteria bacterium]|nr:MAG: hypothetical protein EP297_04680 [Gammaproteobacteria bacterium]
MAEIQISDPEQCQYNEQGQGLLRIEVQQDHGSECREGHGDRDEQAQRRHHRQSDEGHDFSVCGKTLKGKERPEVGIGSVLRLVLWLGPGKEKLSVS